MRKRVDVFLGEELSKFGGQRPPVQAWTGRRKVVASPPSDHKKIGKRAIAASDAILTLI
jgi:hypothetical protein